MYPLLSVLNSFEKSTCCQVPGDICHNTLDYIALKFLFQQYDWLEFPWGNCKLFENVCSVETLNNTD